ncbi:Sorting nexin-13 [Zea mays]|uniref:Sorting nexin-13 n=1 Tax=Zea mays TaxID=4577 RepID=A0A3L6F521_MAIZE|nr:Sorting nexin-13 [Zea mays]
MRKRMESVDDLIEEAKLRTVWWALCIFAVSYFLTLACVHAKIHIILFQIDTSKSMWTNVPMSILILAFLRYLSFKVEFRWREHPVRKQTHLSQASKRQLSANDHRLSTVPPVSRWRRKVGSPSVEAAFESFIEKILRDFVLDLWYSDITPDREAPELIRGLVLHALGELSGRVKEMNLVDMLTRDMVDLIGNHLDIFRKNEILIGVDVMRTLSSEEIDERLKQHLIVSQELHPALLSSEHEYKVLQEIVGGIMALVLRPQDAQSPLVRCFSRELMTCLILQPVMNFASPVYINELVVYLLNAKDTGSAGGTNMANTGTVTLVPYKGGSQGCQMESRNLTVETSGLVPPNNSGMRSLVTSECGKSKVSEDDNDGTIQPRQPDWAAVLDAATKRRSEVLAPENLENMWAIGRNYQKKMVKLDHSSRQKGSEGSDNSTSAGAVGKELSSNFNERIASVDDKYMVNLMQSKNRNAQSTFVTGSHPLALQNMNEVKPKEGSQVNFTSKEKPHETSNRVKAQLKRCNSTPDIEKRYLAKSNQPMVSSERLNVRINQDERGVGPASHVEVLMHVPKIRCRVVGAYFEKQGSKSFAVYSIVVTDADNKSWFVKRRHACICRYRNFERLHRQLKEIPNYSLHLPPKSFLSSSVDDYLVHQRCILLDKYLQDLLSIANIAEQHEVLDFLSASSKTYSAGKSSSVMKTLAVNVDDAMDDIVRQFKGVSDGLKRAVGTSPSSATAQFADNRMSLSWNQEEKDNHNLHQRNLERAHSLSDGDSNYEDHISSVNSGCHSDNEVNNRGHTSNDVEHIETCSSLDKQASDQIGKPAKEYSDSSNMSSLNAFEDPTGIPPEWMPTNVSVPLLNLVDKVFQLKRRGWIRRQVLWISKQILQLVMEDAIDEWIIRQINWLRREDVIVQGIHWIQDTLWPNGIFFTKLDEYKGNAGTSEFDKQSLGSPTLAVGNKKGRTSSFELHLEASRNASEVKKLILDGTPSALVSIIGYKQYRRSARDMYYFLQSNVCIKQLAYAMLEQVLVTVFPELRQLIEDIHEKGRKEQASFTYQL